MGDRYEIIKIEPKQALDEHFNFSSDYTVKDVECKIILTDTDDKKVEKKVVSKYNAPTEEELGLV